MKNLLRLLKEPASVSALRAATAILTITSLAITGIFYASAVYFTSDAAIGQLENAGDDITNELVITLALTLASYLLVATMNLASIVLAYKKITNSLHKLASSPSRYANLAALIFAIASMTAYLISTIITYIVPAPGNPEDLPEVSILENTIFYGLQVLAGVVVLVIVRFFAYRKAVRLKEELFS